MNRSTLARRIVAASAASGAALAAPLAALAQSGTENYYFPPKIGTIGKSRLPIAGKGKVVVKVLVNADGTFAVQSVIRSTNHADDAVALDIAKRSTYRPAARGLAKKPVTAYYDFTINFTGDTASSGEDDGAPAGALAGYETEMRAGKYAPAAAGFSTYLQAHPGDPKATLDLGLTQAFQDDYTSAAATFDKLATIPDNEKGVAAKAYSEASTAALKAKSNDLAVADAKKAVALAPGAYTYNDLGMAEDASGDHDAAAADLEKARDAGHAAKTSDRVAIDLNLVAVLLAQGKDDQAKPILAEIGSLDPSNPGSQNVIANHDIKLAAAADAADTPDVGQSYWLKAAVAVPAQAGTFYGHAALDEVNKKTGSQLDKAKSLADQGLAADPNNALANYVAGYVLAKQGKKTDALAYLNKADASAKAGPDTKLVAAIESLIKQVNGL